MLSLIDKPSFSTGILSLPAASSEFSARRPHAASRGSNMSGLLGPAHKHLTCGTVIMIRGRDSINTLGVVDFGGIIGMHAWTAAPVRKWLITIVGLRVLSGSCVGRVLGHVLSGFVTPEPSRLMG